MFCTDIPAPIYLFFSNSVPPLLYYSHIPVLIISVLIGFFVFLKTKSQTSKILLGITLLFSAWILFSLIAWTNVSSKIILFTWALFPLLTAMIATLTFYFFYAFLFQKDLRSFKKVLIFSPLLPILILTPTIFNIKYFDLVNCEAINNIYLVTYYYIIGGLAMVGILGLLLSSWRKKIQVTKKEAVFMAIGLELFLLLFLSLGYIASYLDNYDIEFYGLFGMVIFMAFLVYFIVKFKAFDIKLLGTQALVWALVILIGAEFFFIQSDVNRILTAITLVISGGVGLMIIRSVKREVAQREQIERLAKSLESANNKLEGVNLSLQAANERLKELDSMKSEFVSLATHQIRGPLAAIKGYISLMVEGDYGKVPGAFNEPLNTIFKSTDSLSRMVTDFLDVSRLDLGQMKYEFTDFDFRDLAKEVINELKPSIVSKGLDLRIKITDSLCPINADRTKLKQVLNNLVDNSNKYTKQGWMEVSVEKGGDNTLFAVKDTGVGISPQTMGKLFQRFSRAKDANDTNILSTGLGLYIAKKMIEVNSGRVWAESEGEGKGSQFYVEIPVVR